MRALLPEQHQLPGQPHDRHARTSGAVRRRQRDGARAPEGDGELDLFVTGSLGITKLFTEGLDLVLGSVAHPARTRVYTASERGIQFTSRPGATTRATSVIAGNLYVPHGIVNWSGELAVFGGVLAEGVAGAGNIAVHYDTDVLRAGAPCGPPPAEQCTSCRNCRNQACIGGMCGACRTSADCCAPLECYRGECVVVPP